jgi:DNA-binding transcriptional ArsR family regulator
VTIIAATTDLTRAARLFHALSDETRLAVIEMLRDGERCVCDLQAALDAAQSRLSFHLKVLKDVGHRPEARSLGSLRPRPRRVRRDRDATRRAQAVGSSPGDSNADQRRLL